MYFLKVSQIIGKYEIFEFSWQQILVCVYVCFLQKL